MKQKIEPKKKEKKTEILNFRIAPDTLKKLEAMAVKYECTRVEVFETAINLLFSKTK